MALLEVHDAVVEFRVRRRHLFARTQPAFRALDGVSIAVERGATLGIVGESGSGKSTLARAIVGLVPLTTGTVLLDGDVLPTRRPVALRRRMQVVFQDPGSSLNPSLTVRKVLDELLRPTHPDPGARRTRTEELMDLVGLPSPLLDRRPGALSGGQRQRIGVARALATEPDVLIADEPTSALDVSAQAVVLNLLRDLQASLGLTLILISHDLAVVRNVCRDIVVMKDGEVVEARPAAALFAEAHHPYSRELLAASPDLRALRA